MYYSLFGLKGLVAGGKSRLLRRHTEIAVTAPGVSHAIHLRLRTTDVDLCRQVFLERHYDCELLRSPKVIVDAGANIGLVSVFYACKYPNAKIVALEPEASNYEVLKKNAAPYPNIRTLRAAVWNKEGAVGLCDPGAGHTTFQTREAESETVNRASMVPSVTLDRLLTEFDLDFVDILKVNIEGAEKEVFETASQWISRVGTIVIDLHDRFRPGSGDPVRAAVRDFSQSWQVCGLTFWSRQGLAWQSRSQVEDVKFPLQIIKSEPFIPVRFRDSF